MLFTLLIKQLSHNETVTCDRCLSVCVVKRYSMAINAGELQTLSIFELLEYIVSEVGCLLQSALLS